MAPGGGGAWTRSECALVWVEGPEAEGFLQGMLTCDVATLPIGESRLGLLLSVKGRIRADLRVVRDGADAFTLVTSAWLGDDLADGLRAAMVSEDADVLGPEASPVVTVFGLPAAPEVDADLIIRGRVPGSWDLVTQNPDDLARALDLPEAHADLADAVRVAAGVALVGPDLVPGETLVHEAGLESSAVSFEKGCYLGQETVARVQYRGKVNRGVRVLALDELPAPGAPVTSVERQVGRVGRAARHPVLGAIAIAVVRSDLGAGAPLHVEGAPAREVATHGEGPATGP